MPLCIGYCKARKGKKALLFFAFADVPLNSLIPIVASLNAIELRLVSIRIPFAQTRQLPKVVAN